MSLYATDGSINVTVVSGSSWSGLYAGDGSLNVIASPGSSFVGLYHPCGALYVTPVTNNSFYAAYAPDGSLYVTNTGMPSKTQGQPVTCVSGNLFNVVASPYYVWLGF